ncbi:MAG: alpha/beta fold hydrolase [Gloeomargaritaceae cyanobacterium C42_A2020_066]|nr:alpha/beta fold hydrolase [Gloeomargaritaceae cyanobacterium C42_A2020_066]
MTGPAGETLAFRTAGHGPPLVFLHGFLGSSACWSALVPYLTDRYCCIALDLPGFGASGRPSGVYGVGTAVAGVAALVNALNISPCGLVGHSFGGWVAAAYALAYPESVYSLALVAAAGIRDDGFSQRFAWLRPLLWPHPWVDWGLQGVMPLARLVNRHREVLRLRQFRQLLAQQPVARQFLLARLRPEAAVDTVDQDLPRLQVPALVVAGERDRVIPLAHAQAYAQGIPQAQLVVLPAAGHGLPQHHAAALAPHLLDFWAGRNPI